MARKDAKERAREKSPRRTTNPPAEQAETPAGEGAVAVAEAERPENAEQAAQSDAADTSGKFKVGDYVSVTSTDPEDAKYLGRKAKVIERDTLGGVIIRGEWDGEMWESGGEELIFEDNLLARWQEPETATATPATPTAAVETPPAEPTVLSDSDRQFLARHNLVEDATRNVELAKEDVAAKLVASEDAKKKLKTAEAGLEAAWDRLYRALRDDPSLQQGNLFEPPAAPVASQNGHGDQDLAERQKAWDEKWERFLEQNISVLELSEGLQEKLAAAEIETLRDLTSTKEASEGQGYTVIDGIGTGFADRIDDAYERVMQKWLAENPQPMKAQTPAAPEPTANQPEPGSYDFVDTFPSPINPTPNETYDADYHRSIIRDATGELTELRSCKDCLSRNVNESGKPLTAASKRTLETKIGETQIQFDEGLDLYAEKFGKTAADAMRRHVESTVEKKAELKGGLD